MAVAGEPNVLHRRPALDGLRGVAVVAVVVYHFAPTVLPAGFLGVDLFFVLSGFLITTLLCGEIRAKGRVDLRAFWGRRFRRLLPAALLALAGITLLAWFSGTLTAGRRVDVVAALGYGANWHQIAAGQSYFALFGAPNPTKHFWSLAIEEQFYLLWPVLLWAGGMLLARRRHARTVGLALLAVLAVASAVWMARLYEPGTDVSRVYFGTDTRAFELLIGALLAVATVGRTPAGAARPVRRPGMHHLAAGAGVAVAVACAAAMVTWDDRTDAYYRGGAFLWCLGVAFVIFTLLRPGPLTWALAWRPLRFLGVVSYGIYLAHWPVFVWLDESATGAAGWRLFALRVLVTLALAVASYHLLEHPVRLGSLLPPGRLAKATGAATIAAVALLVMVLPTASSPGDDEDVTAGGPNSAIVMGDGASSPIAAVRPPALRAARTDDRAARASFGADDLPFGGLPFERSSASAAAAPTTTAPPAVVRPDDGWTPPPATPAMPRAKAELEADASLVNACNWKQQPPLAEYRNNGTGRLVAVMGDSMTVQMRDELLRDTRFDWYVLARCGTAIYSFDHPDPRATPGLPEAFAQLLALHPQALVIALGGTDLGGRLPYEGSIHSLLQATAPIACRAWVNLFPNPRVDSRIPGGEGAFRDFNDVLERSLAGTDVHLLDWAHRAGSVGENEYGYHPWLNPKDWVHLLPGVGFQQRAALLTSDLARCF